MYELKMQLPFNNFHVDGKLTLPVTAKSLIIFSHGFGRSSLMSHEQKMAQNFQQEGFGTLTFDTLDYREQLPKAMNNLDLNLKGLLAATNWLRNHADYSNMDLAYFGTGTGAATAIKAACELDQSIKAIVTMNGRMDMAKPYLNKLKPPTLLIVGELAFQLVNVNRHAMDLMFCHKQLAIVPGASQFFAETGRITAASKIATSWFRKFLISHNKVEKAF